MPPRVGGSAAGGIDRASKGWHLELRESVVALLGVAALVAVLLLLFGKPAHPPPSTVAGRRTPSVAPSPGGPASPPSLPPANRRVPVLVLNNSRITGLAARAATAFRSGGWPVRATGNYRGRIPVTTIFYPPGQAPTARTFAARFPAVRRVLPRFPGLPGSGLTVVVTREFRG